MQLDSSRSYLHTPVTSVDTISLDDLAAEESVPGIIVGALESLNISQRAKMLGRLLASVGPLGLAVLGGGAFAKYVPLSRLPEVPVSDEDAAHATPSQLSELVYYVQQSDPQLFSRLLTMLGGNTTPAEPLDWALAAS